MRVLLVSLCSCAGGKSIHAVRWIHEMRTSVLIRLFGQEDLMSMSRLALFVRFISVQYNCAPFYYKTAYIRNE